VIHQLPVEVSEALEDFKRRFLAAVDRTSAKCGHDAAVYRMAIEALPDRTILECIPALARSYIESQLSQIGVPHDPLPVPAPVA